MLIAYFCAEFALVNDMPSYAGGLGILAGDYMLEAAEQNFPLVGISLYYGPKSGKEFGLKLIKVNWGKRLIIEIPIENRVVFAQVWQWKKGNTSVYFLDTNIKENSEQDRLITEQLYIEDRDSRLKQELILGIGGVRLLKALKISPDLYHLNEGHSAFLTLELIALEIKKGLNLDQAVEIAKQKIIFTNHTLVLEGQEMFAFEALTRITKRICTELNLNIDEVIKLGQSQSTDTLFSMTTLALNLASLSNAVSKIHGEKARELWPKYPIIHITNGIYLPRWDKVKNKNLIKTHRKNEEKLLKLIKKTHGQDWNSEALLIGWSRRFVPYKRPLALLEDIEKLKNLAKHFEGKIHIVYSAPLDESVVDKNEFLKKIYELMNGELKGLLTFIPNYRIEVAETLVAGCDVWLNTPIVGREACGTSGMKAALNGALNLSTNDGWIAEIPLNNFGWTVDDQNITQNLLETLEKKVLPAYETDAWKSSMKKSRDLILKDFSTTRMLREYREKMYEPTLAKKVIAFDVDGTLSEPRQPIDKTTAKLLAKLLQTRKVAIISGGAFEHITKQVLEPLNKFLDKTKAGLNNLILLPTNGGGFYTYNDSWQEIAKHELDLGQKDKIIKALNAVDQATPELRDNKSYGREIQDRGSEITYSALGENAPVELKHAWDPDFKKRLALQEELMKRLPEFEVKIGGTTSIDITAKGMDKAYGIQNLLTYLKLHKTDALFLGDAVYPNGNDFPVLQMGVETIRVSGPSQTKVEIKKILG
jgi:HAD superfamily hydrolase (TIGR01484 family)